jgi:hypothetical protein
VQFESLQSAVSTAVPLTAAVLLLAAPLRRRNAFLCFRDMAGVRLPQPPLWPSMLAALVLGPAIAYLWAGRPPVAEVSLAVRLMLSGGAVALIAWTIQEVRRSEAGKGLPGEPSRRWTMEVAAMAKRAGYSRQPQVRVAPEIPPNARPAILKAATLWLSAHALQSLSAEGCRALLARQIAATKRSDAALELAEGATLYPVLMVLVLTLPRSPYQSFLNLVLLALLTGAPWLALLDADRRLDREAAGILGDREAYARGIAEAQDLLGPADRRRFQPWAATLKQRLRALMRGSAPAPAPVEAAEIR